MGPTASGKTELAMTLAETLPADIISVDSALVYRGMDIGTAKPDAATQIRYPHRLIDIRDPEQSYSAGDFVRDATAEMLHTCAAGRVPLLVGGTMMYFRALTRGIAQLPPADASVRASIEAEAAATGWQAMHRKLALADPAAAERISVNDRQRIQRALEVYVVSGRPLSEWQADQTIGNGGGASFRFLKLGLVPEPRRELHRRIEKRFRAMLDLGFVDEVRNLRRYHRLTSRSASMRAVGYRQIWSCLEGRYGLDEAIERALAATRQLAKRQLTWLRSESDLHVVNPLESQVFATIQTILGEHLHGQARIGDIDIT
jgi:tRNA dimethylallyltransferase